MKLHSATQEVGQLLAPHLLQESLLQNTISYTAVPAREHKATNIFHSTSSALHYLSKSANP